MFTNPFSDIIPQPSEKILVVRKLQSGKFCVVEKFTYLDNSRSWYGDIIQKFDSKRKAQNFIDDDTIID